MFFEWAKWQISLKYNQSLTAMNPVSCLLLLSPNFQTFPNLKCSCTADDWLCEKERGKESKKEGKHKKTKTVCLLRWQGSFWWWVTTCETSEFYAVLFFFAIKIKLVHFTATSAEERRGVPDWGPILSFWQTAETEWKGWPVLPSFFFSTLSFWIFFWHASTRERQRRKRNAQICAKIHWVCVFLWSGDRHEGAKRALTSVITLVGLKEAVVPSYLTGCHASLTNFMFET